MRAMPSSNAKRPLRLPEVNFSDEGRVRHLHLGTEWIQGSMRLDAPTELFHEYTQRMMAWLLFAEPDSVARRQALQFHRQRNRQVPVEICKFLQLVHLSCTPVMQPKAK